MSLAELHQQLSYELSGIEAFQEIWFETLDQQDATVVYESEPPSPEAMVQAQRRVLNFSRESIFRLAREIDELRATRVGGDDLG